MSLVTSPTVQQRRAWQVSELLQAGNDLLNARLNPVSVLGEISGLSLAASGHGYFTLKESNAVASGFGGVAPRLSGPAPAQIRCAMFKRALSLLPRLPQNGDVVELRGRLEIYTARGELQLIVESMQALDQGKGHWFEQFLQLKNKLEQAGCFDAARKRDLKPMPKAIGLVTSLQAAALHDVCTALRRRVPHLPVLIAPASVQGPSAAAELIKALEALYARKDIEVILLVRGGGAPEDLMAFNDEALAHKILQSPVPVVTGIGHETDFTIADFCADLRAPTPTAAAELCAEALMDLQDLLRSQSERLQEAVLERLDNEAQFLDRALAQFGRLRSRVQQQQLRLGRLGQNLNACIRQHLGAKQNQLDRLQERLPLQAQHALGAQQHRLAFLDKRLSLLSPQRVLDRGYAWVSDAQTGQIIESASQTQAGQVLNIRVARGRLDAVVSQSSADTQNR
jgi:exodeoxyribonuclease VII large subunit